MAISVLRVWMLLISIMMLGVGTASAQTYPNKLIRIITNQVGSGSDFIARLVAEGIGSSLGQRVLVENRAGGQGVPAIVPVAEATPDGYTLLSYNNPLWVAPLMRSVPWNIKDFQPITLVAQAPLILVVNPSVPAKSVSDLIALAKRNPGKLNYAAGGTGSSTHLSAELFKSMAGVDIVRISYKGSAGPMADLIAGRVQLSFAIVRPVMPHVQTGKLRALAITSAAPSALFPGLPTVAASGLDGYESISIFGIFAPAKTPTAIVNRLNSEIVQVLGKAEVKEKLLSFGLEAIGSSPEKSAAIVRADEVRWKKVFETAGIKPER